MMLPLEQLKEKIQGAPVQVKGYKILAAALRDVEAQRNVTTAANHTDYSVHHDSGIGYSHYDDVSHRDASW